jgi:hypothetical protein
VSTGGGGGGGSLGASLGPPLKMESRAALSDEDAPETLPRRDSSASSDAVAEGRTRPGSSESMWLRRDAICSARLSAIRADGRPDLT